MSHKPDCICVVCEDRREALKRVRTGPATATLVDFAMLANGYMSEHPSDDDSPIDEAWFAHEYRHEEPMQYDGWRGVHFEVGCGIYIGVCESSLLILNTICSRKPTSTRSDVRRLCRSVGVYGKE